MVVTRIAPSPSGYLHVGNAVNFLLTDWVARRDPGSRIHLRIDDVMLPQAPQAFLDDIFWAVEWLRIGVTDGPSDSAEFRAHYSQTDQVERFRAASTSLQDAGVVFACTCSRTAVAARAPGAPDPCETSPEQAAGAGALRFRARSMPVSDPSTRAALDRIGCGRHDVTEVMGDFVVWRRDNLPSYQLTSVIEDHRMGIDTIVRGDDLLTSSAAQLLLAHPAGAPSLLQAHFVHHSLVADSSGRKMSKRDNADALRSVAQDAGGRRRVWDQAVLVGAPVGITPP